MLGAFAIYPAYGTTPAIVAERLALLAVGVLYWVGIELLFPYGISDTRKVNCCGHSGHSHPRTAGILTSGSDTCQVRPLILPETCHHTVSPQCRHRCVIGPQM